MARLDDFSLQLRRAGDGGIDVVDFKPYEADVSIRLHIGITDRTVMMLHVPSVQLEDQSAIRNQPFIFRAAVRALTAEETLIPSAARFDVMHANEGLGAHVSLHRQQTKAKRQRPTG